MASFVRTGLARSLCTSCCGSVPTQHSSSCLSFYPAQQRARSKAAHPSTKSFHASAFRTSHIGSQPIVCPSSVQIIFDPPTVGQRGKGSKANLVNPSVFSTSTSNRTSTSSFTSYITKIQIKGPKGHLELDVPSFVRIEPSTAGPSTSLPFDKTESSSYNSDFDPRLPDASTIVISVIDPKLKHQRASWGLTRSLLANAIHGVSEGYTLSIRLVGVGYRASLEDIPTSRAAVTVSTSLGMPPSSPATSPSRAPPTQRLHLKLGFAHPVLIDLPSDVMAQVPSTTQVVLSGIDKQRLGQVAAMIRSWRIPEPYNGKGIFVGDEVVKRKEVKKK